MPGFTPVFGGGGVIYPAQQTQINLALIANTTLQWPVEQQVGGSNIAAAIVSVTANAGLAITLSSAKLVSNGYAILFDNIGANSFDVKDAGGNTLLTVASGLAWVLYLRDNSTDNGTWRSFQQGAGASAANAATLAGAGLKAITTTLNQRWQFLSKNVNYALLDADRAKVVTWIGGNGTFTLPNPATVGSDWFVAVKNAGSGVLTVNAAAGTIDSLASETLEIGESSFFTTDGANWFSVGFGRQNDSIFDFVSFSAAGTGDLVLAGAQLNRVSYLLTGILTGNRNIVVPNTIQQYWVDNETTGAFALIVKTAAGLGVTVGQGERAILYCNGVDVVLAQTVGSITFGDGSAPAPSVTFTTQNNMGLYKVAANTLGLVTAGVQRATVDGSGNWALVAPTAGAVPVLTLNQQNAATAGLLIQSGFNMAAANPGLIVRSNAAGGFATISVCGDSNVPGTDDFALFQNGATNDCTIINRAATAAAGINLVTSGGANSPINMNPNGVNAASFGGGAGGGNAIIGVTANNSSVGFRTVTQTTIGAAGGAAALPGTPLGYMTCTVNGAGVKIPYYNP